MKSNLTPTGWLDSDLALAYVNGLPDPVVVLDAHAVVREANDALVNLLNVPKDSLLGHPLQSGLQHFVGGDVLADVLSDMAATPVAGRANLSLDRPKTGATMLQLTSIPLGLPEESGLTAIRLEDVTAMVGEQRALEVDRQAAHANARALERLNEELVNFSHSVAHDLRAPLRFIDKFAYLLMERHGQELSSEALQYAEQIREGSRQTAQLVEDLLRFSQITGTELHRTDIDMTELAKRVVAEFRFDVEERDISFHVGDLGRAWGDRALVHQVFANLIGNAIKFTRPRGHAEITIARHEDNNVAIYTVADNGVGFDQASATRLFTVFQRYHQPDDFEGSGVGLAIVKRIVGRHGGKAWAESVVNEGAGFHFTLEPEPDATGLG